MDVALDAIVDLPRYPLADPARTPGLVADCRERFDRDGVIGLEGFIRPEAVATLVAETAPLVDEAYFTASTHNVYLTPPDESLPPDHVFNRQVTSSKGCICSDQVPPQCALHQLYEAPAFRDFIAAVVGEQSLHPYADPLSSINVHYAGAGKELNWHFDNSEFAITLLLQAPEAGGKFEYVRDLRDAEAGEMNFDGVEAVLDGRTTPTVLAVEPGTLVLFRGRNSIHRVTPTIGGRDRILVVLAYNSAPGIALSETARMTFYGRLQ
ncbi:MAG: HalD/BesD family halogenase [Candidatus Puniceispirillales bacterium]